MPCPTNAPINLPTAVNQPCSSKCNFEYNYGLARCSVTNKSTYLDIQCFDGNNTVKCEMIGGSLIVTSVRLYAPSLNTYDGFHADAELIITHNANGKSLYVCIPIIASEKQGLSAKWFSKVVPFAPTKKGSGVQINENNFTLNDVIPQAAFTIFENGTFDWNCAQDNILILFGKDVAINMKNRDYRTLTSLISKASYSMGTPQYLTFNKVGTTAGPGKKSGGGKGKTMTCKPITYPDGTPITGNAGARLNWTKTSSTKMPGGGSIDMGVLKWVLIVIAAIIVVGGLGYLLYYVFTKGALQKLFGSGQGQGGSGGGTN